MVAIFSGAAATGSSTDAVVVTGSVSEAAFHKLTGGVTGYTIKKNQQTISLSDIKPYDVVTYDAMANTLIVSDLRLTCTYEDAAPNSKAPQTITALGYTFPVLESAWNDTAKFSLGQQVTLLLTADGKVAGMAQAGGQTQSNAYGMATSETEVLMFLPNGGTLKLTGKASGSGTTQIAGQVVAISGSSNRLYLSRFNSKQASGTFDPAKMTVGTAPVSPGVKIFERVGDSEQVEISINSLKGMTIPENKIFASHTNSSGTVDIIVLQEVTGDAYTYGKLKESWENENGPDKGNRSVTVENGTGGLSSLLTGLSFKDGSFGGVVKSTIRTPIGTGSYQPDKASSIITLTDENGDKVELLFRSAQVTDGNVLVRLKSGVSGDAGRTGSFALYTGTVYQNVLCVPDGCLYVNNSGATCVRKVGADGSVIGEQAVSAGYSEGGYTMVTSGISADEFLDGGAAAYYG